MTAAKRLFSRIARTRAAVAYGLWFVLGYLGAHRFYLRRYATGAAQLVIFAICFPMARHAALADTTTGVKLPLLLETFAGSIGVLTVTLWLLTDAFLIPGLVRKDRARRMARAVRAELGGRAAAPDAEAPGPAETPDAENAENAESGRPAARPRRAA